MDFKNTLDYCIGTLLQIRVPLADLNTTGQLLTNVIAQLSMMKDKLPTKENPEQKGE